MITNYLSINSDREENLIRIFPDFPVSVYRTDFSDPSYQLVSWHWHEDFQFCLVERGRGLFSDAWFQIPDFVRLRYFFKPTARPQRFAIDAGFLLLLHQFFPGASDCCQRGCFVGCDGSAPFE